MNINEVFEEHGRTPLNQFLMNFPSLSHGSTLYVIRKVKNHMGDKCPSSFHFGQFSRHITSTTFKLDVWSSRFLEQVE